MPVTQKTIQPKPLLHTGKPKKTKFGVKEIDDAFDEVFSKDCSDPNPVEEKNYRQSPIEITAITELDARVIQQKMLRKPGLKQHVDVALVKHIEQRNESFLQEQKLKSIAP
jgi:hypothetical protein